MLLTLPPLDQRLFNKKGGAHPEAQSKGIMKAEVQKEENLWL